MALRRPLASILSSVQTTSGPSGYGSRVKATGSGFGEARAEKLQSRLSTAIKERRTLAGAASAAPEPVSSTIARRGDMVARKIDRLMNELKDE